MNRVPRLVILNRDGVINEVSDVCVRSPAEWIPLPGSLEAIARLNHAGVAVVVATNQPGVQLGLCTLDELNRVHAHFRSALARAGGHVDGIFFCPHGPQSRCECRMPEPGLLRSISLRFGLPLQHVPFVGDSRVNVEAARAARARPLLVRSGNGMRTLAELGEDARVPCFADLAGAVDHILEGDRVV
jgi:D-glycero-D-manno-heptose 1,7-bisphosphate phosphatase